jgi:hypothetical protein
MEQIDLPLTKAFVVRYTTEHAVIVNAPGAKEAKEWFTAQTLEQADMVKLLGVTLIEQAQESRGSHAKVEDTAALNKRGGKPAPPGGTPGTPVVKKEIKTEAVAA